MLSVYERKPGDHPDKMVNRDSKTGALKDKIAERFRQEFHDVIDGYSCFYVLDAIFLTQGTIELGGFISGGGVSDGKAMQDRLERFICECRTDLKIQDVTMKDVTVAKPRPDAGMPGVDWSITVTVNPS